MTMTAKDVTAVLGPTDGELIFDILATGANLQELEEAWAWIGGDEALANQGRPPPSGRVALLVDLLAPEDEEEA